jgi:hypothetical protein
VKDSVVLGIRSSQQGEIMFSKLEGVIATRAGWIGSRQCVEASYDTREVSYRELVRYALNSNVADVIYSTDKKEKCIAKQQAKRAGKLNFTMVRLISEAMRPDKDISFQRHPLAMFPKRDCKSPKSTRALLNRNLAGSCSVREKKIRLGYC